LFVPMEALVNLDCNKKAHGIRERFSFLKQSLRNLPDFHRLKEKRIRFNMSLTSLTLLHLGIASKLALRSTSVTLFFYYSLCFIP